MKITEKQKDTITQLYGDFKEGELVRIFDSEDFGYYRITVERPLKLNFKVSDERLSKLKESKPFLNLAVSKKRKKIKEAEREVKEGQKIQETILTVLSGLKSENVNKKSGGIYYLFKRKI